MKHFNTGSRRRLILTTLVFAIACGRGPIAPTSTDVPAYDRTEWDLWIDADGDCQDTRQEVLIQESLVMVTLDPRGCRVLAGMWQDEYTGNVYTDPGDLDIDHRVPLANAHRSGGWQWDLPRKRDYANDLSDPEHLVAVSASANRSKGDKGPEAWKPPLRQDWCHYASAWRAIKQRWNLSMTTDEEHALSEMCP